MESHDQMSGRIYVMIPRTLDASDKKLCMSCGRMAAHAAHAAGKLQQAYGNIFKVEDEDLIVLSVASSAELSEATAHLRENGVPVLEYTDTDKAFDGELVTAIVTPPLDKKAASLLHRYSPWK